METELQKYAESFEKELGDFKKLSEVDFIRHYINSSFEGDDNEWLDLIYEYFSPIDIEIYKSDNYEYFEICLWYGWPNIYLEISTRWRTVKYSATWWFSYYEKDLSHYYDEILDLYNLESYV